jgi:hypothetical protein
MSRLLRVARLRLCSDATAIRLTQGFCFAAAPVLLFTAWTVVARHASTTGEIINGLLASSAVTLLVVVLGLALPLAQNRQS